MSRKIIRRQRKWGIGLVWAIVVMVAFVSSDSTFCQWRMSSPALRRALESRRSRDWLASSQLEP